MPTASGCATRQKAYRNDIIPRARGDAVRIKQEAEAYRQEITARSQGDADRFLSVYNAFKVAQDVTLQRLYLETMEEILKNSNKVIIDKSAQGGNGVLPYLPLPALGTGSGQRRLRASLRGAARERGPVLRRDAVSGACRAAAAASMRRGS